MPGSSLNTTVSAIEALLHDKSLWEEDWYRFWLRQVPVQRQRYRRKVRRIIQEQVLGKDLRRAIAKTLITEEGIQTDSALYTYLRRTLCRGNTRALLILLETWKEQ